MKKTINTADVIEKLFHAVQIGKITPEEWKTATDGWKIILKVV